MTLQEAFVTCMKKYAIFTGRASRSEYWWFVVCQILIALGLATVSRELSSLSTIVFLLPSLAVGARRLHDIGKSGWWMCITLIPIIGAFIFIYWCAQEGQSGPNAYDTVEVTKTPSI